MFVRLFRRRPVEIVAPGRRAFPVDAQLAALQAARNSSGPISVDQLPIVQGLVQLHADIIAQFPLYAADRATGRRVVNTPTILDQPDPSEDAGDTKHAIVQSLWFTGNAYGLFTGEAMRVQNPSRVTLAPTLDPYDDRRVDGWHVAGVFIPAKFVAHFKINDDPRTGPLGRSPLAHCWQAVENYAWANRYLADYFRAGGNPSIILKSRTAQDPTQADELWTNWVLARQAGRPAVVPYDVDVAAAPVAGDIGDVVHVLDFAAAEICRAVNVPPSLGNALVSSSLTYSTTLDELRRWLALSLGPTWLARIERGFTALIDPRLRARFDVSELPRLDVFGTQPASADVTTNPVPPQLKVVA